MQRSNSLRISSKPQIMTRSSFQAPIAYSMLFILVLALPFYLMFFQLPLESDALEYYRMSLELLKGEPSGHYWPLGWPLMMAIVQWVLGESQVIVKVFSSALILLTLYLQLRIVQNGLAENVPRWRSWLGYGVILVNAPNLLLHANFALTVVPMAFLGSLLVYTLLFTNSRLATALLIAAMATVRFGSIFILPFVLIYYWLRGFASMSLLFIGVLVMLLISIPIAFVSHNLGKFTLLNTSNVHNLFHGNHREAPIYETWQWGSHYPEERTQALRELEKKYASLDRNEAMQKDAVRQILTYPGLFGLRILTRFSVLLAFDSSIGAGEWHRGYKIRAVALLAMMLVISLLTKSAAVIGTLGSKWSGRHLIWALLLGLSFPHLIAYAHPSYFQMFMNVAIPLIALSAATVDLDRLRSSFKLVSALVLILVLCHAAFIYHMASTRF